MAHLPLPLFVTRLQAHGAWGKGWTRGEDFASIRVTLCNRAGAVALVLGHRAYVARVTDLTNKVDANRLCKDLVPLQEN
jgi:hypothetical protein